MGQEVDGCNYDVVFNCGRACPSNHFWEALLDVFTATSELPLKATCFGNIIPIPVVTQTPPRILGVTCQSAERPGRNSHSFPPAVMISQVMSA